MPSTRHTFSCGHKGFGAQCHRCAEAKKLEAKLAKTKGDDAIYALKLQIARLKALPGQKIDTPT